MARTKGSKNRKLRGRGPSMKGLGSGKAQVVAELGACRVDIKDRMEEFSEAALEYFQDEDGDAGEKARLLAGELLGLQKQEHSLLRTAQTLGMGPL